MENLIAQGANPHIKRKNGESLLHLVVKLLCSSSEAKQRQVIRDLLRKEVDLNAVDAEGNTPLMLAVKLDKPTIVALLLELGSDPSIRNNAKKTPLDLARESSNEPIIKLLMIQRKHKIH